MCIRDRQLAAGQNVVFDVDVVGGCNIKKFYGERALSVFIQPPSGTSTEYIRILYSVDVGDSELFFITSLS